MAFATPLMLLLAAAPDLSPGEVVLPLAEYERLVTAAGTPGPTARPAPPVPSAVRNARYKVTAMGRQARVSMVATVDVLGSSAVTQQLLGSHTALLRLTVDGKPAGASVLDDRYAVALGPGTHAVEMDVAVPVESDGPSELELAVPPAAVSHLDAEFPGAGWQVTVDGVDHPEVKRLPNSTGISAALPNSGELHLHWVRAAEDEEPEEEPAEQPAAVAPGKARAQVLHHLAVEESVLRGTVRVTLAIQKGTRASAAVVLPSDVEVLDVQATDIKEWTAPKDGANRRVLVNFKYGRTGEVAFTVRYERALKDSSERGTLVVPEPVVEDVEAERGFVGVEAAPGVEVTLQKAEGAEGLDGRDLPQELWSMGAGALVMGVKYLEHPVRVTLQTSQRAKVAVADTTLDRATYETVVNAEGRAVSAVNWHVRNHQRQYLEVELPEGAEILSCFVNSKPVRPARGAERSLFIPLDRSTAAEGQGASFPVELVLAQKLGTLGALKDLDVVMPSTNVQAMELSWRVYVPTTMMAVSFGGNFVLSTDPRRMDRWFAEALSTTPSALAGGDWSRKSSAPSLEGYDMTQGVKARWAQRNVEVSSSAAVRVSRPLVGRLYDFRQNLLRAEAPRVSMVLVKRVWVTSLGTSAWLLMALVALLAGERLRRSHAVFHVTGADAPAPLNISKGSLGIGAGVSAVLALTVGLVVDGVVGAWLLSILLLPLLLLLWHLRASIRPGVRKRGWPIWLTAALFTGNAVLIGLAESFTGSAVTLGVAWALSVAARRLFRPVPSASARSAPSTPAAPAPAAPREGGAA